MNDIIEWVEELQHANKLIIVEGKKDVAALKKLGITFVRPLNAQPIFSFAESLDENELIILTDLDPAGKKLYGQLKKMLLRNGKKVDNVFREFLFKNTSLREIEGISTYFFNSL